MSPRVLFSAWATTFVALVATAPSTPVDGQRGAGDRSTGFAAEEHRQRTQLLCFHETLVRLRGEDHVADHLLVAERAAHGLHSALPQPPQSATLTTSIRCSALPSRVGNTRLSRRPASVEKAGQEASVDPVGERQGEGPRAAAQERAPVASPRIKRGAPRQVGHPAAKR